jgi:hypothetical protein
VSTQLDGLESCPLHKRTPFGIRNVSQTQFSVARYSGGCTYNGEHYVYIEATDELIRADVIKWQNKKAKPSTRPRADIERDLSVLRTALESVANARTLDDAQWHANTALATTTSIPGL